jgi:hypothetical protein
MAYISTGDGPTKEMFKQAIFEVLQEQKDWFQDLFAEVIEDIALVKAIKEGEDGESVSKEEVFTTVSESGTTGSG